jgi:N-formylglutamate amidohydrolase
MIKRIIFLFAISLFIYCKKRTIAEETLVAQYINYYEGSLPIILSAPHGGTINPSDIPDRDCPDVTTVTDKFTIELTNDIDTALYDLLGCHAYRVINTLARIKLDPNRPVDEATCGNAIATTNYNAYQEFLTKAKTSVQTKFGKGLVLDIHGLAASRDKIELGYLLSKKQLQLSDAQLDAGNFLSFSSIKNLAITNAALLSFSSLMRGPNSFGTGLMNKGYPAVPSQLYPAISSADNYFDGGYITKNYGSVSNGTIDAIQMETNYTGIRNSAANRKKFATSVAMVIKNYLRNYYFKDPAEVLCR